jgi:hypothetical protein
MPAFVSIPASIRTILVSASLAGVGSKIFRDIAPPQTAMPYITISDELANPPSLLGDKKVLSRDRLVQISVWQTRQAEDLELVRQIRILLDGAALDSTELVYGCRVFDTQRLFDSEHDSVLHSITLRIQQKA